MRAFLVRRLLSAAALVCVVATIVFFLIHLVPGDPALTIIGEEHATPEKLAAVRSALGLDRPLHVQYATWAAWIVRGDLGRSLVTSRPVRQDLGLRLPRTLELIAAAVGLAVVIGVPLGVVAARHHNGPLDMGASVLALVGVSAPVFVTGTLLVLAFSVQWRLLPSSGWTAVTTDPAGHAARLLMPAVVLSAGMSAVVMRMTRSSLLEVVLQDFIRTARAKGLAERRVLFRHALKNSLIPVVTVIGVQMGNLLGGSVIVEEVFAWPGVSTYLITGVSQRDYPVVQGVVLVICLAFVLINLGVDLLYGFLDPRIRYQ
ncbi:MAG: ABC transporter permease [Armatimonadota bacterium]|nr:ABC transporter permease [Armatimonadota bacterium]